MFDYSPAGLKEGLIKALKVAGYIALSGAIAALIDYIKPLTTGELGAVYGIVNLILVFAKEWLLTRKPQ